VEFSLQGRASPNDRRNSSALALFGTEAGMVMTLSTEVDSSKPLRQRRGRSDHRWSCVSTVELPVAQLTQNATEYVN